MRQTAAMQAGRQAGTDGAARLGPLHRQLAASSHDLTRRGAEDDGEQRQSQRDERHVARWKDHPHPDCKPSEVRFHRGAVFIGEDKRGD